MSPELGPEEHLLVIQRGASLLLAQASSKSQMQPPDTATERIGGDVNLQLPQWTTAVDATPALRDDGGNLLSELPGEDFSDHADVVVPFLQRSCRRRYRPQRPLLRL